MSQLISILVPVYNERENIEPLFSRLGTVIRSIKAEDGYDFEVVVTDNHSTDGTYDKLQEFAKSHDGRDFVLRVFRFSKNIGFQKSILVGYRKARGAAAVQIDADLQDPPELIGDFLKKWREGYHVVYGVRRSRQEGLLNSALRRVFYRVLNRISDDHLPPDSGDFRLLDRQLIDVVCAVRDQTPYLRGLVASLGMRQTGIPYDRSGRTRGVTKFKLHDLVTLSWNGIANHSVVPLVISSYFAIVVTIIAAFLGMFYFSLWWFFEKELPLGFITLTLIQLGGLGALAFLIGIQGEYISRMYIQIKEKPLAIIQDELRSGAADGAAPAVAPSSVEVIWVGHPADSREGRG